MASPGGYPLFEHWYKTTDWILDKCDKLPRNMRFTLSGRIASLSLEVLELIIEAIYAHERSALLKKINLDLEKLRVFFRLCKDRRLISISQYEFIIGELQTTGKMVGGWMKQQQPVS